MRARIGWSWFCHAHPAGRLAARAPPAPRPAPQQQQDRLTDRRPPSPRSGGGKGGSGGPCQSCSEAVPGPGEWPMAAWDGAKWRPPARGRVRLGGGWSCRAHPGGRPAARCRRWWPRRSRWGDGRSGLAVARAPLTGLGPVAATLLCGERRRAAWRGGLVVVSGGPVRELPVVARPHAQLRQIPAVEDLPSGAHGQDVGPGGEGVDEGGVLGADREVERAVGRGRVPTLGRA